jgi:hypothetical protein
MEVEASWLEQAEDDAPKERKSPTQRPSRTSKAALPAMPRRETIEVQADWLETEDRHAVPPPLPPSDTKRTRQPWEPPSLPPPPATAARTRKVLPPPLPRTDDEPSPPAETSRPSRKPPRR